MSRITWIVLCLVPLLASCGAPIKQKATPAQRLGQVQLAGIGDVVLRLDRERNLENAFGRADVFGRKTKEGFTELRFGGVESDGSVVLFRQDVQIITNETTMSRTPIAMRRSSTQTAIAGSGATTGNVTSISGAASSDSTSVTLRPADDYHIVAPSGSILIRLDPGERRLPISGYLIEIVQATTNSLEYRVQSQDR